MPLTLQDVYAARQRIAGTAMRTPTIVSALSARVGHKVALKLETLQPIGAFKIRGAANAIARLSQAERERGVVCCSTGNHGRAVAYAAKKHSARAVVCLSKLVPEVKVAAIEALGAEVVRIGKSQDEAGEEAQRLVEDQGMINIPPFDHPDVISGQGTIALELLEDHPDLGTIVVPLSGGGLIAGIAMAAKSINPAIRVVGVSMDRGAAMAESLAAGKPVEVEEVASLADSLGGGIGLDNRHTFTLCQRHVDDVILLSEEEIYAGMRSLFFDDRLVAEGASAVGHGALISDKLKLDGPAAMIISGANVDMQQFSNVMGGRPINLEGKMVGPA
ncbi:hydroxyectoine utilization dehydratase EutB [Altererythrobacter sp.]|uniref:hydroxyectoine utilization dehydratase EutB n=1 Tax=Altererythrobacter sp. TaxID=1872480 RepID=UPI003D0F51F1